jgi:large subunit ribosomal protein L6
LGAELEIEKDIITIKSVDKEIAGQATANLEKATQIKKRDKRVFQDGIYIINKAGKEI